VLLVVLSVIVCYPVGDNGHDGAGIDVVHAAA
jgi:hypothetical protein